MKPQLPRCTSCSGASLRAGRSRPGLGLPLAFTLIEMLGVLAVIAILAGALVPMLIRQMDRMARENEVKALQRLRDGLERHILRQQNIPNHTTFAADIAAELGIAPANVLTNDRKLRRVMLIDCAVTNTLPIPYDQTAWGLTNPLPTVLGVVLLSSVSQALPTSITNGFASTTAGFSNIWNTPDGAIPTGWTWTGGKGEDLKIERLNLSPLFVPLVLNYDTWTVTAANRGRFSAGASPTNALPGTTTLYQAAYLKGTPIGLHGHSGTVNTLQATEVLQQPTSFVYELDTWRGKLFLGRGTRTLSGLDLQAAHDLFMASPLNTSAKGSPAATPGAVVTAMSNYMVAYINWANTGFAGSAPSALNNAQKQLETVGANYIFKPSN